MSSTSAPAPSPGSLSHSGLGIASCVLGLLSGTLFLVFAMLFLSLNVLTLGHLMKTDGDTVHLMLILLGGGIALAFALGVTGLFQERKRLFPILGCIISLIAALPPLEMLGVI